MLKMLQTTPGRARWRRRAHPREPITHRLKSALWRIASRTALHGLYTWDLLAHWLRLEELGIPLPGLPEVFDGATLVQISDLHSCPLVREQHLRRYIEIANGLAPDFVAITGDFITVTHRRYARAAAKVLAELRPRIATLACLGNHDYGLWLPRPHGGLPNVAAYVTEQLAAVGVDVLTNVSRHYVRGDSALHFVGVGDLWSSSYRPEQAFAGVRPEGPVIALCHNPDAAPQLAARGADLVLSGHTHGKAVPDTRAGNYLFPVKHRHFTVGRYALGDGRFLYVNSGLGHSRRVHPLHRPEITRITLRAAPARRRRRSAVPQAHARLVP